VVNRVRVALPDVLSTLPTALQFDILADQSLFVKAALCGAQRHAGRSADRRVAHCRHHAVVARNLACHADRGAVDSALVLCSVIALSAAGQSLNVRALGGLALAVAVLIDDTTVGIEDIYRVLEHESDTEQEILADSGQIAIPTLVSTMAICNVFVPIFILSGVAGSLHAPLAMAVVFAMSSS